MNTPLLVAQLFALGATIALIWLVVRAFRKHIGWGFAVLLLSPFAATVFGIKYWKDEKRPFLVYISTFVTALALTLYLFTVWGGWELVQAGQRVQQGIDNKDLTQADAHAFMNAGMLFLEHSEPGPENQQQLELIREELDRQQDAVSPEPAAAAAATASRPEKKLHTLSSITRKVVPKQEHYRLTYIPIKVADAKNYVGSTVKVTRRNVPEKEYRLTGATANSLEFSQRNRHGSFSFKFRNSDIEKIRVLTKQPS